MKATDAPPTKREPPCADPASPAERNGNIDYKGTFAQSLCKTYHIKVDELVSEHLPDELTLIAQENRHENRNRNLPNDLGRRCEILTGVHFQQDLQQGPRPLQAHEVIVRIRNDGERIEENVQAIKVAIQAALRAIVKKHVERGFPGAQGRTLGNPRVKKVVPVPSQAARQQTRAREQAQEHAPVRHATSTRSSSSTESSADGCGDGAHSEARSDTGAGAGAITRSGVLSSTGADEGADGGASAGACAG